MFLTYSLSCSALALLLQGSGRGPRMCHYTHLLYCHDCHVGHVDSLPSRILHKWDFTRHPVCDTVHEYLAAIAQHPMISVTTINPGLYTRYALRACPCPLLPHQQPRAVCKVCSACMPVPPPAPRSTPD